MMWIIALGLFSIQLLVAVVLKIAALKTVKPQVNKATPISISIIIPFHNEVNRINELIQSLNKAEIPANIEFIFVDDHSVDSTVSVLQKSLNVEYRLIKNQNKKGKKWAIKQGVMASNHSNIVTWDADISFAPQYLTELCKLSPVDLCILPVHTQSNLLVGKLAIIEFDFLKTLGFGLAGFGSPVLCYGANLFFQKETFLAVDKKRTDYDIPSGDDLFLMEAMRKNGISIAANSNKNLSVKTNSAQNFKEIIQQRQRWFGKMGALLRPITILPLMLLIATQVMSVISIVLSFTNPLFLIPLGIKYGAEVVAAWDFAKRHVFNPIILLLHQLWYPVYNLALFIPLAKEKRWTKQE